MTRYALAGCILLAACYPTTTRPPFPPAPSAPIAEVELLVPAAMRALAVALDEDSIPVRRTEADDGWLETDWFDVATLRPSNARRLGEGIVKVRAWADRSRPEHSNITIETVYRPLADPSRDDRSLERQVSPLHPVALRVVRTLNRLTVQYGVAADTIVAPVPPSPVVKKP